MVNLNREFFIIITYIMNVLTHQKKPTTKPQPVTSKKSQTLTATKS